MTNIYRVVLLVIGHDDIDAAGVERMIENVRYPNHSIAPRVMEIETREVEWTDDHPLNQERTQAEAFEELFEAVEWYHVLVENSDRKRHLIAIEARTPEEARKLVAVDWGDENIREVTRAAEEDEDAD